MIWKKDINFDLKKRGSGKWGLVELSPEFIQWWILLLAVINLSFMLILTQQTLS